MPKKINCDYYVVKNEKEKIAVLRKFGRASIPDLGYKYPYIIGQEVAHIFQNQKTDPIETYKDKEGDTYVYNLKTLED